MISAINYHPAVINKICFRAKESDKTATPRTAIDYAREKGNSDIVDIIESNIKGKTALDYAKEKGNSNIIDIIESNVKGKTALDYAKEKGNSDIIDIIEKKICK